MRGLMTAVIGMGVLILVGATILVVLMVQRMSSGPAPNASAVGTAPTSVVSTLTAPAVGTPPTIAVSAPSVATLEEPEGTRIAETSLAGDRLAMRLAGGGPDRVVVLDTRTGRVVARAALAR